MPILVVPRKTSFTPDRAIVGHPGLFRPPGEEVHISVLFTWDLAIADRLKKAWADFYPTVKMGGPACADPGGEFTPGMYVKNGVTFTSRGCPHACDFCLVPEREGKIRELEIKPGRVIGDNNLLACSNGHIERVFVMLREQKRIVFSGGLDARRITDRIVSLLKSIRVEEFFLAFDSPEGEKPLERAMRKLKDFHREKKRCYVLIGRDGIEKDTARIIRAWELGTLPFTILYQPKGKKVEYSREYKKLAKIGGRPAAMKKWIRGMIKC